MSLCLRCVNIRRNLQLVLNKPNANSILIWTQIKFNLFLCDGVCVCCVRLLMYLDRGNFPYANFQLHNGLMLWAMQMSIEPNSKQKTSIYRHYSIGALLIQTPRHNCLHALAIQTLWRQTN